MILDKLSIGAFCTPYFPLICRDMWLVKLDGVVSLVTDPPYDNLIPLQNQTQLDNAITFEPIVQLFLCCF